MSNIPNRLMELVATQKIVPFLGSGFSIPSGVPSWPSLVAGLIRNCASESQAALMAQLSAHLGKADLAEVLDMLSATEYAAKEYLNEQINSIRYKPSDYHRLMRDMGFDVIITTNWDLLIENSLSSSEVPFRVIYRDIDVSHYEPTRSVQILKIHGTISDPDSLVYKGSQYRNFWRDRPLLQNLVCTLMATRSFLFMGYGFGDPNVLSLLETLRDKLGRLRREHYALTGSPEMNDAWHTLGVKTIDIKDFNDSHTTYEDAVNQFLISLSSSSKGMSLNNLERARLVNSELDRLCQRMPPKPVLRMRGALGWLSNPIPVPGDPIYGNEIQDKEERHMTELICSYLECNSQSRVRCILHLDVEPLFKSGYQPRHLLRRLLTIKEMLNRYPGRIEIVHQALPSQLNHMIFDEHASLLGFKRSRALGINRATFGRMRSVVRAEAQQFDEEFEEISDGNKIVALEYGIDTSRTDWRHSFINRLIDDQCEVLNSRMKISQITDDNPGLSQEAAIFINALEFALAKHREYKQTREDDITPYGIHILRVVERVRTIGLIDDYSILAAAALHDVVEDCEVTVDQLRIIYGNRITSIVKELSRAPDQPRSGYIDQFRGASKEAQIVKLADRWDNILDLITFNKDIFGNRPATEYIDEAKRILSVCQSANSPLANALELSIKTACDQFNCG